MNLHIQPLAVPTSTFMCRGIWVIKKGGGYDCDKVRIRYLVNFKISLQVCYSKKMFTYIFSTYHCHSCFAITAISPGTAARGIFKVNRV